MKDQSGNRVCQRVQVYVLIMPLCECLGRASCQGWTHPLRTLGGVLYPPSLDPRQASVVSSDNEHCWQHGVQKEQSKQAPFVASWIASKEHFCLWTIKACSDRLRQQ